MGFAPVSNPKLASLFIFREPKKANFGGTLAAPVFRNVMHAALRYLGVPPDKTERRKDKSIPVLEAATHDSSTKVGANIAMLDGVPDFRGLTIREVLRRANELSLPISIVGSGIAIRQKRVSKTLKVYFESKASGGRT
jgi:hypothetical protein